MRCSPHGRGRPQHGPRHREKEPSRVGGQVRRGPVGATAAATAEELSVRPSAPVGFALAEVIRRWRRLCGQHFRTTLVSHGNTPLAPLIRLILCVPKFNWLIDNYPRLAEWASSASRVGILLFDLDLAPRPVRRKMRRAASLSR